MTPTPTPRHMRGASLAIGGMFVVASTMLVGSPTAGAAPSADAVKAIDDHYPSVSSVLGQASGEATDIAGGAEKDYAEGAIFYSKETGAKGTSEAKPSDDRSGSNTCHVIPRSR